MGQNDSTNADLTRLIEKFEKDLAGYDAELVALQSVMKKREDTRAVIASLKQLRGDLNPMALNSPKEPPGPLMYAGSVLTLGSTVAPLWKIAEQVLASAPEPMSAKEITDSILALGRSIEGKTPVESIRTTLIRKRNIFLRLKDGRFWLMEREKTAAMRAGDGMDTIKLMNRMENMNS